MSGDYSEELRQVPQGQKPVQIKSVFIAALKRCATYNQIFPEDSTVASVLKPILDTSRGDGQ